MKSIQTESRKARAPLSPLWILFYGLLVATWIPESKSFAQQQVDQAPAPVSLVWSQLQPLPEQLGVAGAFAGINQGHLLVGGGANFPQLPPWEGGTKVWHDRVWEIDLASGDWSELGKLPRPLGYGVTVSTERGVACFGGSDRERHYRECFLMIWRAEGLQTEPLPELPIALANAAGALVGQSIYICGGTETPDAMRPKAELWKLDLSMASPSWEQLEACPGGPRLLPVAASDERSFYLIGGADLKPRSDGKTERFYRRDAWAYSTEKGWRRLADAPVPIVAAPSPAPLLSSGEIVILGGDTGEHVGFQPPERHPGFSRKLFVYNPSRDEWRTLAEEAPVARVTAPLVSAPLVSGKTGWLLISGEQRPGVRSPEVWHIKEQR